MEKIANNSKPLPDVTEERARAEELLKIYSQIHMQIRLLGAYHTITSSYPLHKDARVMIAGMTIHNAEITRLLVTLNEASNG